MISCIDAHHYLWRYYPAEDGWIGEEMRSLRRDCLPSELRGEMDSAVVQAAVCVQARQALEETEWLLRLAAEHSWIAGPVRWAAIGSKDSPA
jgi:L-fuconolactonase